ncbi:diacylglycerol/lipid kinase family protein [Paenibacillus sp. HJGM_3]|uniref:diacylglycerol/lipid kinase family protein n=1 Tax=Paenibacillus sp. HJGM_3 TaxID=3379816 RepID=UPI003858B2E7
MIWFIVNRTSGNGNGAVRWAQTERRLAERGIAYGVRYTEYRGHARELAETLAAQPDTRAVVALGGDGTVNEVAGGLIGSGVPMGCIPSGSGNDFARSVGVPTDPQAALERIVRGEVRTIDAAQLNGRRFVISAGIGFDGEVARMTNESFYKRWLNRIRLGSLSYVISVLRLLVSYKPQTVTVELDGAVQTYRHVWLIAVANLPYYGGGMRICPDARGDDGRFHLCLVEGITRGQLLMFFPRVFTGTHTSLSAVHMLSAARVRIRSEQPLAIHVDGEWGGTTPAEIELIAGGLNII